MLYNGTHAVFHTIKVQYRSIPQHNDNYCTSYVSSLDLSHPSTGFSELLSVSDILAKLSYDRISKKSAN